MSVYDKETETNNASSTNIDNSSGTSLDNSSGAKKTDSPEDLNSQESNPQNNQDSLLDNSGETNSLYSDEDRPSNINKKKIRRRRAIAGGGGGLLACGLVGLFMASTFLLPIHFSKLLQNFQFTDNTRFSNSRTSRFAIYAAAGTPERGRLGYIGNSVADRTSARMERVAGLRPEYNRAGRLTRFAIVDQQKARGYVSDMQRNGHRVSAGGVDVSGTSAAERRSLNRTIVRGTGLNSVSSVVASRLLNVRGAVNMAPFRNLVHRSGETVAEFRQNWRSDRGDHISEGTETPEIDNLDSADQEDLSTEQQQSEQEAQNEIDEIDAERDRDDQERRKNRNRLRLAGGGAAAVALLCAAKQISDGVGVLQHANIVVPLMRVGVEFISVGEQIKSGEGVTADELREFNALLNDPETGSVLEAESVQAEMGGSNLSGTPMPGDAKPARVGEKPVVLETIDQIFDNIGLVGDTVCSRAGQYIVAIAGSLTPAGALIFALQHAAAATGNDPMEVLADWITRSLAAEQVDTNATGPELGNYANYGARLAANEQAISMGGRELTEEEVAELRQYNQEQLDYEFQQQSMFARIFNPLETRSLVSKAVIQNPVFYQPKRATASFLNTPIAIFSSIFNTFSRTLSPDIYAQSNVDYDYGFEKFGFSIDEINDSRFENPMENEEWVLNRGLDELSEKYTDCFGTELDNNGNIVNITEGGIPYSDILENDDCTNQNEELTRYRMYLADIVTATSLYCFEGDTESCDQLGIDTASLSDPGSTSTNTDLGISPDGFVFPLQVTKQEAEDGWDCHDSEEHCHHNYPAVDLFAPTGTAVVAARGGTVVRSVDGDGSRVGSRVTIKGDDDNLYYYTHMGNGTIRVDAGETVAAGDKLGEVGTSADAEGTPPHLHFDILPPGHDFRPGCSDDGCASYQFIDPQPALIAAFEELP